MDSATYLAPVVQKLDTFCIRKTNHYIIHWVEIYPLDGIIIYLLNKNCKEAKVSQQ